MAPSIGRPKTLKVAALQTSATPSTTIPLQAFVASLYSIPILVVCLVQRLFFYSKSIQTGAFCAGLLSVAVDSLFYRRN